LSYGTGQVPDYLIYKGDTLAIFSNPLQKYFEQTGKRELIDFIGCGSTACWRGYKAIWELKDHKLYLKQVTSCHNDCGREIKNANLKKMFGTDTVFAEWFSGTIKAPKGKLINYIHMGYASLYEKEEIFIFKKGKLTESKTNQNYVDLENGISRTNNDTITNIFFQEISKLDWSKLTKKDCDDEYFVTIGKKGTVSKVEFITYDGDKWNNFWYGISHRKCTKIIKKKLSSLQFDIIQRNDKPLKGKYRIELFYDEKLEKLENWSD
jgi:hypothetical protein